MTLWLDRKMILSENQHGSIKKDVVKFLAEQPDDISIEEIVDYLLVKQKMKTLLGSPSRRFR
jgi:hypothetical protein